jgi:hypothetical protein
MRHAARTDSAKAPALREKPCRVCRQPFTPRRRIQPCCGYACEVKAATAAVEKKQAKAAKEDRKKTRAQLEAIKSISDLEADCRKIVQKIARIRDRNDGCISCHMGPEYRGQWHGSHYRAHGGCSSLQMHLWNIHKACAQCNLFKGGNREGFVRGLLLKPGYGRERLDWLDNQPKSRRFERDYLLRFKAVMGRRMRRLENRSAG